MRKMNRACLLGITAMMLVGMVGCGKTADQPVEQMTEQSVEKKLPEVDMSTVNNLSYEGYHLVWADEFEGKELNREDWNVELHDPGWVNKELQAYVDSEKNIYLEDGNLYLMPIQTKKADGGYYYTSGRVSTQHKQDFTYGMFECRAKVPAGKGYLPAFWLMSTDEKVYGQWPRCGEIDCMEVLGDDLKKCHGTIHYGNPHSQSQGTYTLPTIENFSSDFHTFTCEWEPGKITWYCDGYKYHEESDWYSTTENQGTLTYPAPFDSPFYIILNLAVGGEWVGYPDGDTFVANPYVIDYVRVFQKDAYDENVTRPVEEEAELREADATGNFVINGNFAEEENLKTGDNWKFMLYEGGVGTASFGNNMLTIESTEGGSVDYGVQLVQPSIPMQKGSTYRISFDAYASEDRSFHLAVKAPERGWIEYFKTTTVDLTTKMQTYTYEFKMQDPSDPKGRLEFNMGNAGSVGTIYLTNVRIEKIGEASAEELAAKTVLADGNYLYNGRFWEGDNHVGFWDINNQAGSDISVTSFADGRRLMIVNAADVSLDQVTIGQGDLAINGERSFQLKFDIEVEKDCTILVNIGGYEEEIALTAGRQQPVVNIPSGAVTNKTFTMQLGVPGTVYVDSIMLSK